jgi:enoyl-CoA hydratase
LRGKGRKHFVNERTDPKSKSSNDSGSTGADVIYSRDGKIGYITLSRPERLNALTEATYQALEEAFTAFGADAEARVAIVKGDGRAFSAGASLGGGQGAPPEGEVSLWSRRNHIRRHAELWVRIWDFPKPTIAQVHGYCLGSSVMLAMSCDLTIVAEDAVIGWPKLPVGGGYIGGPVAWHIGPKRAKEMEFRAGSEISGQTAAEWGLANRAVPIDKLGDEVRELAEDIARMPGDLVELQKASINRWFNEAGYREFVLGGADWDVISHQDSKVRELHGWIRELGFKGARIRYQERGL